MEQHGTMIGLTLALIFALSTAYALALQTRPGKRLAHEKTHYTVIVGTALVILPLGLVLSWQDWALVVGAFVVAGVPIVLRSEYNDMEDRARARRTMEHDEAAR